MQSGLRQRGKRRLRNSHNSPNQFAFDAVGASNQGRRESKIPAMNCPVNPGDVLAGKYCVEEVIGEGGMGVVVAARHLELDQRVAMKFLLPSLTENKEAMARFRREARAAVKIKSEHVARVLDVGSMDDGTPFMVIEYLHGRDLAAELRERGPLDPAEAAELVLEACEAIAAAHAVGIVHRDLKPSNLFLTQRSDYTRCLKVLDFGISKSLTGDSSDSQFGLTRTRAVVGSPLYMAPEQLESSRNADERADIWSLGVILHELVTGSVPFRGESLPQLVRAVLVGDRKRPSALNPNLTADFEAVIDRCLAHDREHRFTSVTELAHALAPFTETGAASAMRVSRILRHSVVGNRSSNPAYEVPNRDAAPTRNLTPAQQLPHVTEDSAPVDATAEAPTVSSWGDSNGAQSGHRRLWVSVGVFLAAAAGVVVWLTQEASDPVVEGTATTPSGAIPPVTEVVAAAALGIPSPPTLPTASAIEAVTSAGSFAAQSDETSTYVSTNGDVGTGSLAISSVPAVSTSNTMPKYVAPVRPALVRPTPAPAPETSAGTKPPAFTDFGGRR